jgi:hypothetical protein
VEKWNEIGDVYENKDSYPLNAGISMKTSSLMFSAEISYNIFSYAPEAAGLVRRRNL